MLTNKNAENAKNFNCISCDFKCRKKSEWNRHILTHKHISLTCLTEKDPKTLRYVCMHCNKKYKSREGLWYHNKKCKYIENNNNNDNNISIINSKNKITNSTDDIKILTDLVLEVVKSNNDLQKQTQEMQKEMIDVCKNGNNIINSNYHSNNKTFNMQVFLNEKCKDAMNIMDFVDSFQMQLSDLEDVGKLGYVEGISNIIIKKLNEMDVNKRPVHCSDSKRESLFVKDNNVWEKEESGRDTLRRAIKYISKKNSDLLPAWSEENPSSHNIYSKRNDDYIRIVLQAMGGSGDIEINENKIIKRIAKEVLIHKK